MATTMTICAVFVPVAFMEGIIGRFFYQFGLTVAFAVLISLFVAFTLTPMLSSRFLSEADETKQKSKIYLTLERAFVAVEHAYRRLLAFALRHTGLTVLAGIGIFIFSLFLLSFIDVSFFPREDESRFSVSFKLPENTPISVTKQEALEMTKRMHAYPGVKSVVTTVASGSDRSPNKAELTVNLVGINERAYSQEEIIERVRNDFQREYPKPRYEVDVGGGNGKNLQFILQSDNAQALEGFGEQLAAFLRKDIEGAVDVTTSRAKSRQEMTLFPLLTQANDLGITPLLAATQTRTMFEGEKVGQIESNSKRYDIRVRLGEQDRRKAQDIESVTLKTSKGNTVPLMSAVRVEKREAPTQIERYNGQRQLTVEANYLKKDITVVTAKVQDYIAKNAPPSVTMSLEGEAEILGKSVAAMMSALMLAVLLIYMILCVQYERYIAPLVIMAALPLSFTGAFGALLLTNEFITVYTMIGLILLMGIVTKNGILLIDFTLHKMSEGLSVHDALMEAGPVRLRPILMTTFAAGFGMVPIAIGHGEGGEAKASMGIAVIGGLIASTFLTLVIVPCLFTLAERFRGWLGRKIKRRAHAI
jgi:HAE1 family hydrophobic/amphiphilic exporter-1